MKFKEINWWGWANSTSGYGIVNLEYATALQRIGVDVSYGWERQEHIDPQIFQMLTMEQRQLLAKPYVKREIGIIKTTPELFFHNMSDFRIGYTMVENTKIGKRWTEWCNNMDMLFVPSAYLIDVFKESGVKRPVISVKQGIDSRKFPYVERTKNNTFVFGTVGYQDDRKNWQDLVTAFCSEFDKNEPVQLWIKNTNPYWVHKIFSDERIRIINRMYTFEEVQKLYSYFDCFVFPSHAEGSGLPPREAMATGIPCIVTNWSGLTEVADPAYSFPIQPVAIDFPDVRGVEQPGHMARIDVQELMFWMRYAYEHPLELKAKGKLASEFIHKNYSWEACALDMKNKMEAL